MRCEHLRVFLERRLGEATFVAAHQWMTTMLLCLDIACEAVDTPHPDAATHAHPRPSLAQILGEHASQGYGGLIEQLVLAELLAFDC